MTTNKQLVRAAAITYSGELIPGSNSYAGVVWIGGTAHRCGHRHAGFTSAKGCADLRALIERRNPPALEVRHD